MTEKEKEQKDIERIIKGKPTIQFRKDTLMAIATIESGACSEFINACLIYDGTGEITTDFHSESAKALFTLAKPQLDEARSQYINATLQRINAGKKSAEARKNAQKKQDD